MLAWIVDNYREEKNMKLKEVEWGTVGPKEVLVKIHACGINNKDIYLRKGTYYRNQKVPFIVGSDISGVIESVGEQVGTVMPGDRVVVSPSIGCGKCMYCMEGSENFCQHYHSILGGFAQYIVVPAKDVLKLPDNLSFIDAAALPIAYMTAWNMLYNRAQLKKNQSILMWGASSGVGTAAILLAQNETSRIIAVTGNEEKKAKLETMGITHVLNYNSVNVNEEVMKITKGKGINIIFDPVGKAAWNDNLHLLMTNGIHVNCARNTGSVAEIDLALLFTKQITLMGAKSGSKEDLKKVIKYLSDKNLKPIIDRTFEFEQAEEALNYLELGEHLGKVILKIS